MVSVGFLCGTLESLIACHGNRLLSAEDISDNGGDLVKVLGSVEQYWMTLPRADPTAGSSAGQARITSTSDS